MMLPEAVAHKGSCIADEKDLEVRRPYFLCRMRECA